MPRGPKRVQEAAKRSRGFDLRQVWKNFGKGLGGQNGQHIGIFGIFLDMFFEILILVDFCSIFDNFDGGDGESKPVTGVCHGEEDRKASDICV